MVQQVYGIRWVLGQAGVAARTPESTCMHFVWINDVFLTRITRIKGTDYTERVVYPRCDRGAGEGE